MSLPKRWKVGTRVEVWVEDLDESGLGQGMARMAGGPRPVLVEDGLPGEAGEAVVLYAGRRPVLRLVHRSRAAPSRRRRLPCPRWTPRSPCRLMHMRREAALELKRRRVAEALAGAGVEAPVSRTLSPSPPLRWRASATFVVARGPSGLVLGAYRRRSHVVQPMEHCPLHEAPIEAAAAALPALLARERIPLAHPGGPVARDRWCGGPRAVRALLESERGPKGPAGAGENPEGLEYVVMRASRGGRVAVALLTPSGRLEGAAAHGAGAVHDEGEVQVRSLGGAPGGGLEVEGKVSDDMACGGDQIGVELGSDVHGAFGGADGRVAAAAAFGGATWRVE